MVRRGTALYFYTTVDLTDAVSIQETYTVQIMRLEEPGAAGRKKLRLRREEIMRRKLGKAIKYILCVAVIGMITGILDTPISVNAEEAAVFHVQASEVRQDGTIRVSVYMTDTVELGGIDAELVYDPVKVTYVSSGRGRSFAGGFGETNCDEASSIVKCVTVYPDAKTAHGELMYAVFKLNGIESYQPEFRVIDLLDASVEIKPIPYTITYQQTDGSWTDTRDGSEKAADENVIAQALEAYGAPEDMEGRPDEEEAPMAERIDEEGEIVVEASEEGVDRTIDSPKEMSGKDKSKKALETSDDKPADMFEAVIIVSVVLVIVIAGFIIIRGRRRRNEE